MNFRDPQRIRHAQAIKVLERDQIELPLQGDEALPLDNLDPNIRCDDALFADWPKVDAIIGNPPYLDARLRLM